MRRVLMVVVTSMPEMRPAKKPNVLPIMVDDVGQGDIEYYWKSGLVQMPNIEMLGAQWHNWSDILIRCPFGSSLCSFALHASLGKLCAQRTVAIGYLGHYQRTNPISKVSKEYWRSFETGWQFLHFYVWKMAHWRQDSTHKKWIIKQPVHILSLQGGMIGRSLSLVVFSLLALITPSLRPKKSRNIPNAFSGILTTDVSDAILWKNKSYNTATGTSIITRTGEGDPAWDSTKYNQTW